MMPQRLALAAAGLAAAVVLTVGLVAAGFAPTSSGQPVSAGLDEAAELGGESSLAPEIVYVRPAPTPETIVLEERASTARSGSAGADTGSVSSSRGEHDDDDRYERGERDDDERDDDDERVDDDDDERERDERERDDD